MTVIETISLITLVGASFMAGYKIGKSQKNKSPKSQIGDLFLNLYSKG